MRRALNQVFILKIADTWEMWYKRAGVEMYTHIYIYIYNIYAKSSNTKKNINSAKIYNEKALGVYKGTIITDYA